MNKIPGKRSRLCDFRSYDDDFTFRPDRPDVRYFIDHRRKTSFLNMDADPDATGIVHVRYRDQA